MRQQRSSIFKLLMIAAVLTFSIVSCKPKDSEIQQDLTTALSSYQGVSASVTDGVATLTGEVSDPSTKTNAEEEAKKVKGVKSVVNNLTVAAPPPPVSISTDDSLRNAVNAAISTDYKDVQATVNDGVVTLTGTIKRSELPKLMQKVNEMRPKRVENQLVIK
jgi:hyperosmotically inducible periplasmic protein